MANELFEAIKTAGASSAGMAGPELGSLGSPDATHDGAPGGLSIGDSLPSVAVPGGPPARANGYAPSRDQDALPRPGSSDGCGVAPDGIRR